ncbi:MAG: hypothetical protein N3A67_03540 [Ignavibacteria bacterium]|nr:hypothetical protein [Ignavibacteria bacterium]
MKQIYYVGIALFLGILIISYYSYISFRKLNENISPIIFNELIKPYSRLIIDGDYQKAYENYTTHSYKSKHSFSEYNSAQINNKNHFGELLEMSLTSGIFIKMADKENKWIYRGTINYKCSKISSKFTVDVAIENGVYKIAQTYPSQLSFIKMKSMIY